MKEGKVFKRILAVALVVVMTITMVPFGVFAAEGDCAHETYTKVPASTATCTEPALQEHYECNNCHAKGKLVSGGAFSVRTVEQITVASATGHNYGDWTIVTAATCTTAGEEKRVCANDATHVETRVITATGHNYGDWTVVTAATCTTAGEEKRVCANDTTHVETKTINATGHTGGTATCEEQATCLNCGQKYGPVKGHAHTKGFDPIAANDATCTEKGNTAGKYCKDCGKYYDGYEEINANGHSWSEKKVKKDDNQHAKKCSVCDEFDSTTLENHSWKLYETTTEATCTTEGVGIYRCISCEAEKTDKIAAKEHALTKTEAVAATCTKEGNIEYYTCSKCDKTFKDDKGATPVTAAEIVVDMAEHELGEYKSNNDATCEKNGTETAKCKNCTYEYTRTDVGTMYAHTFEKYVSNNDATCIKDGTKTATCEECKTAVDTVADTGSKDNAPHVPDENGAYCTLCGKELTCVHVYTKEKLITKVATCETKGQKAIVCTKCHANKEGTEEEISALGHKWDEGTVKTPATCEKKGEMTYKCINDACDKTKSEEIAIVEHDYKAEITHATCTEDGYTTYTCSMCGSHYVDDKVEAFGHMFDTYFYDEGSATCYQDGTKTATCTNGCGAKSTIADPGSKTDHEITDFAVIKAATCLEDGEEEAKCFYYDKCGYSEIVPVDALGHDIPAEFVVDKAPTCTEKGSQSKKCTRCPETVVTEEIPALGHEVSADYTVDVAPTCTTAGTQSKHCVRCDYKEGEVEVPALGHDYKPGEGTTATCLEPGKAIFVCTRCADSYEEPNSPALGHDFAYVSDNNATCLEDGTESGKCSRCDATDTRTQVGSKLDHVFGEPVVTPATTKADGVITKTCTLCNYSETEEIAKIESIKLKYTSVAYDGKYKRPGLTILDANGTKLTKGVDYTLVLPTKEECSEIGTFTYTINFMGNYEGEETVSYKVVPGKTSKIVAKTTKQSYITLKWSAVKGADGYRVYVKNSKGKWTKLANVKGKNYYKVEDLKAGTEYTFAVKAFTKTDDGTVWATEFTEMSFKTLPGKTSKITYKANKSAVKLTWKAVNGADGYRVYVYNTKTKKYKTVATVKGNTTYTVKNLKANSSYKYAVKAYYKYNGETVWSNQYTTINTKTTK